jgi:formylglycine-generating enzyme required for sulfatase activity
VANDADCDGVLTAADCDDNDPSQGVLCGVTLSSGIFDMGCTPGQSSCHSDESPVHSVTLTNNFWMGETEVTQGQWSSVLPGSPNPSGFLSCPEDSTGATCPVETVNWYEALAFANDLSIFENLPECYTLTGCTNTPGDDMECSSVSINNFSGSVYDCEGYRLPTEAEWEYAARAGTDLLYAGSNTIDDVAWYNSNSGNTTHAVATKAANAWGLYDMSGNVWEWTWDRYDSGYYSSSPSADPEGPSSGSVRVIRGGSWDYPASSARVAYRNGNHPFYRVNNIGFRLSRTVP